MKQSYIIHEHHPRLLLFFAGWGADETPFKMYRPAASDFMVCYDYRTLDFDASGLEEYREINLIGWSMGVWAASQTVPQLSSPGTSGEGIHMANSIAINGTPYPIDQHMGIPPAIYHGTLDGLTGGFTAQIPPPHVRQRSSLQSFPGNHPPPSAGRVER